VPVARASVPVARASVPVARASVPVAGASAPVARASVPVAGASAPVAGASAPVAGASVPVARASVPVARASVPIARASVPVARAVVSHAASEARASVSHAAVVTAHARPRSLHNRTAPGFPLGAPASRRPRLPVTTVAAGGLRGTDATNSSPATAWKAGPSAQCLKDAGEDAGAPSRQRRHFDTGSTYKRRAGELSGIDRAHKAAAAGQCKSCLVREVSAGRGCSVGSLSILISALVPSFGHAYRPHRGAADQYALGLKPLRIDSLSVGQPP
jgi:hypothetical protein